MTADPHYNREASRYTKPVASREYLLQIIDQKQSSVTLEEMTDYLQLSDPDMIEGVRRRLRAMVNDGQLAGEPGGGYRLIQPSNLREGRVRGHKEGHGHCIFDDGSEPVLIRPQQMRQVFDGDRVLICERFHDLHQPEGIIVDIVERNTRVLAGHLCHTRDGAYILPLNRRNQHQTVNLLGDTSAFEEGTIVSVDIEQQPEKNRLAQGRIGSSIDYNRPGQEIHIALLNHRLRHQWSNDAIHQAETLSSCISKKQISRRHDLRELPFITIDGKDSKDFDDAVFARQEGKSHRLWVAIADVSEYVTPGSALDTEAQLRGNSVYFPREVIAMLPERLSNGICSLNPNEDRLALVCEILITAKGKISDFWFFEAVFRSHQRLTYDQVSGVIDSKRKNKKLPEPVRQNIDSLVKTYRALVHSRNQRGALAIELPELQFEFNDDKIRRLNQVYRTTAHKIIEEAMLAANVCAARCLLEHNIPTLYRIHATPDAGKVEEFRQYIKHAGLHLGGGNQPQPKHFQQLINQLTDHPNAEIIYSQLLRTMKRAEYTPEQLSHFGLACEHYSHFTSPIRRYPDLLVHRALRALIHSRTRSNRVKRITGAGIWKKNQAYPYDSDRLATIGSHCTDTETRAEEASRDVQQYLRCIYLQRFIGDTFEGIIRTITKFGMFIEMRNTCSEGLLHISQLDDDYYIFDAQAMTLRGERTGTLYSQGGSIEIRLVRVDIEQGMIDLEPVRKTVRKAAKKPAKKTTKRPAKQTTNARRRNKNPGRSGLRKT